MDIVAEGYDLALRAMVGSPPDGLIARALRAVPLVIAASTEYLRRHGTPELPRELARHDSVMVGNGHSWHFTRSAGGFEVPARVVLRLSSTSGAAHAISTGIGIAALPLTVIEDPQFRDVLRTILTEHPLRQPMLFALYAARRLMPPKIRTFIDHLVEYMGAIPLPQVLERTDREARHWQPESATSTAVQGVLGGTINTLTSPQKSFRVVASSPSIHDGA